MSGKIPFDISAREILSVAIAVTENSPLAFKRLSSITAVLSKKVGFTPSCVIELVSSLLKVLNVPIHFLIISAAFPKSTRISI